MEYKASLDKLAKGITIGVFILFISIGMFALITMVADHSSSSVFLHSGILLLLLSVLIACWLYAPKSYTLENRELHIIRRIGNITIKCEDMVQARIYTPQESRSTIRTFGVGGLFGYFGKFYTRGIGHTNFYATQWKNHILIVTKTNKKFVITPDDIHLLNNIENNLKA